MAGLHPFGQRPAGQRPPGGVRLAGEVLEPGRVGERPGGLVLPVRGGERVERDRLGGYPADGVGVVRLDEGDRDVRGVAVISGNVDAAVA